MQNTTFPINNFDTNNIVITKLREYTSTVMNLIP